MSTEIQTAVESSLDKGGRRRRGGEMLQQKQRQPLNVQHKKHKPEESRGGYRCCRKRSHSFAGGNPKFFQPHKKRKQVIPPTKFLLGGNINDPLNLNSLQDEEVNRAMNAVTPESSPIPTPQHRKGEIEVIIPPNIHDPLNLAGCEEDNESYEALLSTPIRKVRKKHKKKRQRSFPGNENSDVKSDESKTEEIIETELRLPEAVSTPVEVPEVKMEVETSGGPPGGAGGVAPAVEIKREVTKPTQLDISGGKEFKKPKREEKEGGGGGSGSGGGQSRGGGRKFDSKDKIVSPVIPQPGAWSAGHRFRKQPKKQVRQVPKFREQDKRFQYGNYNRYYGYRNPNQELDPRLKLLATRRELFRGKDVLDIGCNTGHVTLSVARDLGARAVVGLDVDRSLVEIARNNVRHYVTGPRDKTFPISMPILYGSLDIPGKPATGSFPHNVSFVQGNYVLQSDVLLELEQPQFDVILCLSVTKWFHLNWGDRGVKNAFRRMYAQLRPGGSLILEAQSWTSYKKKKTLTETIWKNYNDIKLFPTMFTQYLLTEVGFSKCEVMGSPMHHSKGFQRPIRVFTKGETPVSPRTPAQDEAKVSSGKLEVQKAPTETTEVSKLSSECSETPVVTSELSEVSKAPSEDFKTPEVPKAPSEDFKIPKVPKAPSEDFKTPEAPSGGLEVSKATSEGSESPQVFSEAPSEGPQIAPDTLKSLPASENIEKMIVQEEGTDKSDLDTREQSKDNVRGTEESEKQETKEHR